MGLTDGLIGGNIKWLLKWLITWIINWIYFMQNANTHFPWTNMFFITMFLIKQKAWFPIKIKGFLKKLIFHYSTIPLFLNILPLFDHAGTIIACTFIKFELEYDETYLSFCSNSWENNLFMSDLKTLFWSPVKSEKIRVSKLQDKHEH